MKNKFELKGSFANYKQVRNVEELPIDDSTGRGTDFIYIENDDSGFYLQAPVTCPDCDNQIVWDTISGEGETLEEAEKNLESDYDRFLTETISEPQPIKRFPKECDYLIIDMDNDPVQENTEKELVDCLMGVDDIKNIFSENEYTMWYTKERIKTKHIYENGTTRKLDYTANYVLFRVGGDTYHIGISDYYPRLYLFKTSYTKRNLNDMKYAKPISKVDIVKKWIKELDYLDNGTVTKNEILNVISFLDEVKFELSNID